jgi:hypothetical protein
MLARPYLPESRLHLIESVNGYRSASHSANACPACCGSRRYSDQGLCNTTNNPQRPHQLIPPLFLPKRVNYANRIIAGVNVRFFRVWYGIEKELIRM